jgi:hypothetical protein
MSLNEPLMPETPKERRRWIVEQTAVLVRDINLSIKKAQVKLKVEWSPAKKRLLSGQISKLQQFRSELERNTKSDDGQLI